MKKQLLSGLVAAAVLGTLALPVSAQNVAIVNGKAVPQERVAALKQQAERPGRPGTPSKHRLTTRRKWNWPVRPF